MPMFMPWALFTSSCSILRGYRRSVASYARLRELHVKEAVPFLPKGTARDIQIISRCLAKDPDARYQSVAELLDDLEEEATAHGVRGAPQDQQTCEVDEMVGEAKQRVEQGHFCAALNLARRAADTQPEHAAAQDMRDMLQQRWDQAQQLYASLQQDLHDRNLEEQLALLSEAVKCFPDHPEGRLILVRLEIKARNHRHATEDGLHAAQRGEWEFAMSSLERAAQLNSDSADIEGATRQVASVLHHMRDARELIDKAIAAESWDYALALARGVDAYSNAMADALRAPASGEPR